MGGSSDSSGELGGTDMIELTGKVMVVAIILLLSVTVFFFCLHLYAKWFWQRREQNMTTTATATRRHRRRRLDFGAGYHQEIIGVPPCSHIGLQPCVLKTIPVVVFDPNEFKDGLECAVCLCEVCGGEKARILPKCNHGFHVDCIDMWFQSHSTCPLCRNPVSDQKQSISLEDRVEGSIGEESDVDMIYSAPSFPTNVLIWGDDTRVSTSGLCMEEDHVGSPIAESSSSSTSLTSNMPDGIVVIDIPRAIDEEKEHGPP